MPPNGGFPRNHPRLLALVDADRCWLFWPTDKSRNALVKAGTARARRASKHGVDDDERQALRGEGLNPDDPAVIAAIDLVRWELSLGT
jgi:hypothetical protein